MNVDVDVVILSKAINSKLIGMTVHTVNSLIKSDPTIKFNIILIESSLYAWPELYDKVNLINLEAPFNYNEFMNHGLSLGNADWCLICNNDLDFKSNAISNMIKYGYDSMSAKCQNSPKTKSFNKTELGYEVGKHITGWCILFKREVWNRIGKLDICVNFWCSDNVYAEQLKQYNIKHYYIHTSIINHLGSSNTLNEQDVLTYNELTKNQVKIFNKKYGQNLFNLGT